MVPRGERSSNAPDLLDNLQVWFEHDYDTRLIHSNLAFPLLRRLTEAGDPVAKRVYKKEIIKRYENGSTATREFLEAEGFLRYLTIDEKLNLILDEENFAALVELSEEIPPFEEKGVVIDLTIIEYLASHIKFEDIKNRQIIELNLWNLKLQKFPRSILKFRSLEVLNLRNNKLKELPEDIDKLSNLKELWLSNNKLVSLPDSLCNFNNLEHMWLDENKIEFLLKNIGNLKNLKSLIITNNNLKKLPESICKLKKIEDLLLSNNLLKELPKCLVKLKSLRYISLERNKFDKYPEVLKKIENFENEIKIDID